MTMASTTRLSERAGYRVGEPLSAEQFARIRNALALEHCKWDPQVGDVSTLANFPLIISAPTFTKLTRWSEQMTAEAMLAERELLQRPELWKMLGLTRCVRAAIARSRPQSSPRILRYDFHWTTAGWQISECNADVPGGYCEASALPALMSPHYPHTAPAGDPGGQWARSIARRSDGRIVALLSAPGYMEDHQVVRYLATRLREYGAATIFAHPSQIQWRDGGASLGDRLTIGAIVRFYQSEWIAKLPRDWKWRELFAPGATTVANPGYAILIESKRFPLVWDALRTTSMDTWRTLLPETRDPRDAPWQRDETWLLKTALCNTGETVSIRALLQARKWRFAQRCARWFPRDWVAQKRFDPIAIDSPIGPIYPCIGVYTIDGVACGAYLRISARSVIDFEAIDAALLLEKEG